MRYLADTNYLSELLKDTPNKGVMEFNRSTDSTEIAVSTITLAELQRGISQLGPSERAERLQIWLDAYVRPRFRERTLAFGVEAASIWGVRVGALARRGRMPPLMDSLLAATALVHDLAIVTRNSRDFEQFGVAVVNPWES